jgi:ring-1,2-phenylacetyl-CoA epoxidase subunit PaaA
MQWKIKMNSNDELRQKFVNQTVPQADYLELKVPDDDLKWNDETQNYEYGAIDWQEFYAVIAGHGPCNRERLAARVNAYENGQWFRDGLVANAEKRSARAAESAA